MTIAVKRDGIVATIVVSPAMKPGATTGMPRVITGVTIVPTAHAE